MLGSALCWSQVEKAAHLELQGGVNHTQIIKESQCVQNTHSRHTSLHEMHKSKRNFHLSIILLQITWNHITLKNVIAQKSDLGNGKCTAVEDKCKVRVKGRGARMRGGWRRGAGSKENTKHKGQWHFWLCVSCVVQWKCQKSFSMYVCKCWKWEESI